MPCVGVVAFMVLALLAEAKIGRLRSSIQSLLLVPQVLHFKPESLNLFVKTTLQFRERKLRQMRFITMRDRPICDLMRVINALIFVAIHNSSPKFFRLSAPSSPNCDSGGQED